MRETIAEWLFQAWCQDLEGAFHAGRIPNEAMMLAELYRTLQALGEPEYEVWLRPELCFPPSEGPVFDQLERYQWRQTLEGRTPGLLITRADEVVGVVELRFHPQEFVDFRPDVRLLAALHRMAGKDRLLLGLGSQKEAYTLHGAPLLAYGLITRRSSLAFQARSLQEVVPDRDFPRPLLHLIGAIDPPQDQFAVRWLS